MTARVVGRGQPPDGLAGCCFRSRSSLAAGLLCGALAAGGLAACSSATPDPVPAARALARGLSSGDLGAVPLAGATAAAQRQLSTATGRMRGLRPVVRLRGVPSGQGDTRTARFVVSWDVDATPTDWTYRTSASLVRRGKAWAVRFAPTVVHPGLSAGARLVLRRAQAPRADLTGAGGQVLVTLRPVRRIGIDKTKVEPARAAAAATSLAAVLGTNAGPYAARVQAAGPSAYVEAVTLREADAAPLLDRIRVITGAVALPAQRSLAPTRDFARPVIGTVGEATAEMVAAAKGRVLAGDLVGLSGLQRRYDERLRGVAGTTIEVVAPAPRGPASASPSSPPAASATPSSAPASPPRRVFHTEPTPGAPVATTLDERLQRTAESLLAPVAPPSAIVALKPSTGAVLAAASGPGGKGYSTATLGRYPPGSTFKVVTSLALLRAGLTPESPMRCTPTLVVDGKTFKNYSDYPADGLGAIPLRTALANSCNTAFISQRAKVTQGQLAHAAASLGLGVDRDLGLAAFLGSVPSAGTGTAHAASMIGQGRVLASPLAMAVVAGSVAAGRTVTPQLLGDPAGADAPAPTTPTPTATTPTATAPTATAPLTAAEATTLQSLLRGVVDSGSARFLGGVPGPPIGAKTGTAEYGTGTPPRTHGWMIAIRGDLAVAVFVQDAESGSRTAGPLLEAFLRRAGP